MEEIRPKKGLIRSAINFFQGVALTIFLFAITLGIYLIVIYHTRLIPYSNYAIVFDAGSSHTEMFVYYWPADKSNGLGTTSNVNQYFVCSLKGIFIDDPLKNGSTIKLKAISDFEQNLDLLDQYFRPCLETAMEKIPESRQKMSPIFLGATAGMRLSRLVNATRANQILEKIRDIFSRTPFQFVVNRQVRILTGIEEAVDGWITTNILLEKFKHRHANKKHLHRAIDQTKFDSDMVGVLDLGGASTQVTFTCIISVYRSKSKLTFLSLDNQAINQISIPDEFTTNITLFDAVYSPYAHSYLCWGKNEALKRHRARLANAAINANRTTFSNSTRILIRDPCLARGTNDTVSVDSIFRSPCTENEKQKFNNFLNRSSLVFVGIGNATQCRQRLTNLFDAKRNDLTVNCTYQQEYCSFDHTFQPPIPNNINFIGLSGYFYVFNNLAFGMQNPKRLSNERYELKDFSFDEITQRLFNVCETSYAQLYQQESMTNTTVQHKRGICFDSWYTWLLLTYGIGFNNDSLTRLSFANTFPTGKVGWTLGYMINQTNYIPAEYREKLITKSSFVGWLTTSVLLAFFTLLFLLLTCYLFCIRPSKMMAKNKHEYVRPNEVEVL